MCESGKETLMWLPSEANRGWRYRPVDSCIAPLVAALRSAGYETTASCCGHGIASASVLLADGREVVLRSPNQPAPKEGSE